MGGIRPDLRARQLPQKTLWRGSHASWDFRVAETQDISLRFRNSGFSFLGEKYHPKQCSFVEREMWLTIAETEGHLTAVGVIYCSSRHHVCLLTAMLPAMA